jgi:hypothetical protein
MSWTEVVLYNLDQHLRQVFITRLSMYPRVTTATRGDLLKPFNLYAEVISALLWTSVSQI